MARDHLIIRPAPDHAESPSRSSATQSAVNQIGTAKLTCAHCGQQFVGFDGSKRAFCCNGCAAVFGLIHRYGLNSFYDLKGSAELQPVEGGWLHRDWSTLDQADTLTKLSRDGRTLRFHVEGLSCSACVWILERLEQASPDTEWSRLDLSRGILTVCRKADGRFSKIATTISELGYRIEPVGLQTDWERLRAQTNRRELIRVGLLAGLTGNIMLLAVSLYGGADAPVWSSQGDLFRWTMGALALPVVTWGAWPIYLNSWRALRARRISLDLPIALAVLAGGLAGGVSLFTGYNTLFFDSVAMLVFLLQASRTSLMFLRQRFDPNEDTVPSWRLQSVRTAGTRNWLAAESIVKGIAFELMEGERLPVDATVESTDSQWDLSVISGESHALAPKAGSSIPAGARLLSSTATLTAEGPIDQSRVARLIREWREGPRLRPSLSLQADRVGQWFSAAVILAAVLLVALTGDAEHPGWVRALSLLVVSCPCVFGIAIPLAESLALNASARSGLIVREPTFFDRLLRAQTAFLDKTGTLTSGRMTVTNVETYGIDTATALAIAQFLEQNDQHPVARALCDLAVRSQIPKLEIFANCSPEPLQSGGRIARTALGTYEIASESTVNDSLLVQTTAVIRQNEKIVARFTLTDELRRGALDFVTFIKSRVRQIRVLSGDRSATLLAALRDLNLDPNTGRASLLPEMKASIVRSESPKRDGQLNSIMIGDGANDAEALRAAGASIAVRGDFVSCLEASDAILVSDSLHSISQAYAIAERLKSVLKVNLVFASTFNVVSATLAATGHMSPLLAAILMPTSSLCVTIVSWLGFQKFNRSQSEAQS